MEVALIQAPLKWENPSANRDYFQGRLEALKDPVELVVLPEMFTTGFTMQPQNIPPQEAGRTLEWMQKYAKKLGAALTGSLIWPEGGTYRNRMLFVFPDGTHQYYDKRHTFTLAGEDKVYQRGRERKTVHYGDFKFCLQICYDLRFPVWARNTEDYDVLLYVANWPHTRIVAWDTLLRARAIENMSYVLGVNRVGEDSNGLNYIGHSAAYDPLGEEVVFSEKEEILRLTLKKKSLITARESLKFLQDRDSFTIEL